MAKPQENGAGCGVSRNRQQLHHRDEIIRGRRLRASMSECERVALEWNLVNVKLNRRP